MKSKTHKIIMLLTMYIISLEISAQPIIGYSDVFTFNSVGAQLCADFSADTTDIELNQLVQFTDLSSGVLLPNSWIWDFGDGTPYSMLKNPIHVYSNPGTFSVKLTVSNIAGVPDIELKSGFINVNSQNNEIELQIVETGEQGVVKWVGYQYRNSQGQLITINDFPVQDHKASITWNSKELEANDFNDEIILYTEFLGYKMQSGHIKFEYEHATEKGVTRNAVIFFHNDDEMCKTNGKTFFPYSSSNPDYDKNWVYYKINEYTVSMLIPPDNDFPENYNKAPLLFVHGWEGWFKHETYPDATWGTNEVSYWFTTVEKVNDFPTFQAWQFYYPYNTDHLHIAYCLKEALTWLNGKYSQKTRIVTHSMGGLVTMRYLTEFNNAQTHPDHLSKNFVEKVIFSAPPSHGSLGANLYHKTALGPVLENLLGYDSEAPAVRDLKLGSDATWFIHHNPWPDLNSSGNLYDDYFVLLGSTYKYYASDAYYQAYTNVGWTNIPNSCLHEEAKNHHDGIVSISSGSLLDEGIGFATFYGNHNDAVHMQSFKRGDKSNQNVGDPDLLPNIVNQYFNSDYQSFINYLNGNPSITAVVNQDGSVAKPTGQNICNLNTNNGVDYQKGLLSLEFGKSPNTDIYSCWYNRDKQKLYLLPFNYSSTIRKILPKWWMDLIAMPIAQETFFGVYLKNVDSKDKNRFYFNQDDVISKSIGQYFYKGCAADLEEGINTIHVYNGFFRTVAKSTINFRYCESNSLLLDNTKSNDLTDFQDNTDVKFQLVSQEFNQVPDSTVVPFFIDDQASNIAFVISGLFSGETGNTFSVKLQLPDGNVVDSTYSEGTFRHDYDLGEFSMTIPNPQPGKWKIWIESDVPGTDTLEYQAITYLQSKIHAYIADSIAVVSAGRNYLLKAGLQMDTLNLSDSLNVKATIFKPSGFSEVVDISATPVQTDSSFVFQYNYPVDTTGYYMIKFNYDGVYNGHRFERAIWQQFEAIDTIPFLNIPDVVLRQQEPQKTLDLSQYLYNVNNYDTLYFSTEIISTNLDSVKFSSVLDSLALSSYLTTNLADTGTVIMQINSHFEDQMISDTLQIKVLLPDLTIDNLLLSDVVLLNDSNFTIQFEVNNYGNFDAGAYDIRYYISQDSLLKPANLCLGLKTILHQNVDSIIVINDTISIPTLNLNGDNYFLVKVDAADQIFEPNESNNMVVIPVYLNPPPAPPVIISTNPANESVQLTWTSNYQSGNTGYVIHYGADSTGLLNKTYTLSSDTLRLITGLTNETTYYFAVSSYKLMGVESELSAFVPATPSQISAHAFQIPQGWSGISTYLSPSTDNIEPLFDPIFNDLIILQNETGVYWPGQNINTLGAWNTHQGYQIKVANAVELTISGVKENNKTLQLAAGWNLIPVLSECAVDVAGLFVGTDVIIVKTVAGLNIYWPEFGINSLGTLEPGKAYFVMIGSEGTIEFPGCEGMKRLNLNPLEAGVGLDNLTAFRISPTPLSHTIAIPAKVAKPLYVGDILTVYDERGQCFGLVRWQGVSTALTIFGNDPTTGIKDGFDENEPLCFRIIRDETEFFAGVSFDAQMPVPDKVFTANGLSAISEIKATGTGVGMLDDEMQIQIIPNPAKDAFMLVLPDSEFEQCTMKMYRVDGQIVAVNSTFKTETIINISSLSPGIYILKIELDNSVFIKRIVKN